MKIYFDNVNFQSNSGPNSFGKKLAESFVDNGHEVSHVDPDVQLSFIQSNIQVAPMVLRLDGIYFNSEQDWNALNAPIQKAYHEAAGVIFQSSFNRTLTERYFGTKESTTVIHNGTDVSLIEKISTLEHPIFDNYENVWCCASSWRPHKRLSENIRYFLEHSSEDECLVVAGQNPDYQANHPRVYYVGNLDWVTLISLYKKSKYFIHLALMDHCPNVVVDARASGCQIICASSGGTPEIAGTDAIVIEDMEWDLQPFRLYDPPPLDFSKVQTLTKDINLDINRVAHKYLKFLETHSK